MNGRPTGVTVVAILDFIGGVLNILLGISVPTAILASVNGKIMKAYFAGMFNVVLAVALIIGGIVAIVVGYGLLKGFGWGWWIQVILSALGALLGSIITLISGTLLSIIGVVVNGLIIYYFTRPHVKAYFGM